MARQCVSGVVYFIIFAHIVGGLTRIIRSNARNNNWSHEEDLTENIATGVVSMILGLVLLLGVVKRNHQIVFAYMCITTAGLIIGVALSIAITIMYHADALTVGIIIISLIVAGAFQYCVYLYYADLKNTNLSLRQQGNFPQENDNLYSVSDDIEKNKAHKVGF